MIEPIMKFSRAIFFPLLLTFVLLFAQQTGTAHSLRHALEDLAQQQENKQAPHSSTCEKCADYAQLGSALNVGAYDFIPLPVSGETIQQFTLSFRSAHILAAAARGPPQSKIIT
jgi:hypothetical protein